MRSAAPRSLRLVLALLVLLGAAPAGAQQAERVRYRAALVEVVRLVRDLHALAGPDAPGSRADLDRSASLYAALDDRQIDLLASSLPISRLQAIVSQSRRLMHEAQSSPKLAVVAAPDVSPAVCGGYPAAVVLAALGAKHVAQNVIKALEYTCQESIAGVSVVAGCVGPEIAATSAEIASALAGFCGGQQSAATNTAVLHTERSIARHLDLQLDVPVSTRATQTALDTARSGVDAGIDTTTDIRTRRDEDAVLIGSQLADALQDLSRLAADVTELQSRADDVAFRVLATQADVEDTQRRGADLQQRVGEFAPALDADAAVAAALRPGLAAVAPAVAQAERRRRRDQLAAALGEADARVATFALPRSLGGSLEEAREVLIESIAALQTLGQGDSAAALTRLAAGDAAYNEGRFPEAWRAFSEAYRALDPHVAAAGSPP